MMKKYDITTQSGEVLKTTITRTTSKGRTTYGNTINTLRINGTWVATSHGVNFDMIGDLLGTWLEKREQVKLATLSPSYVTELDSKGIFQRHTRTEMPRFYSHMAESDKITAAYSGLGHTIMPDGTVTHCSVDGACGVRVVRDLMSVCGYQLNETTNYNRS